MSSAVHLSSHERQYADISIPFSAFKPSDSPERVYRPVCRALCVIGPRRSGQWTTQRTGGSKVTTRIMPW
ncbi:MAG: hypothetical protein BMS9Abin09_1084 [Gammaproteobacteria bacterium]|nr:MAG: hypothetical protein BMS9Abin09_1084 [Gammaproteobacteria bacterium]